METRKKVKLGLTISIILFVISVIAICVLDPYSYANVDLTRDDNKIAQVYDVAITTTPTDDDSGVYDVDATITLKNTTKETLMNVVITFLLRDDHGKEVAIECEEIELQPRIELEKLFTCELKEDNYRVIGVVCKIDGGEEFEMLEIDELCSSNPIYMAVSVIMLASLISLIVCSVRIKKINKKFAQIEEEAYEKRADKIVDLQIQAARQELQQSQGVQNINNDVNKEQTSQPKESVPDKIVCDYCGRLNDRNAERCASCNSLLRR